MVSASRSGQAAGTGAASRTRVVEVAAPYLQENPHNGVQPRDPMAAANPKAVRTPRWLYYRGGDGSKDSWPEGGELECHRIVQIILIKCNN